MGTRAAEIAVFLARRGRSEILVVHRCRELGGYWHTIAGGIEAGEAPDEAARRELDEETGLRVGALGDAHLMSYPLSQEPPESRARFVPGLVAVPVHSYLVDVPDAWEPTLDWEHDGYRWCDVPEACATFRWPETAESLRRHLADP